MNQNDHIMLSIIKPIRQRNRFIRIIYVYFRFHCKCNRLFQAVEQDYCTFDSFSRIERKPKFINQIDQFNQFDKRQDIRTT